MSDLYYHHHSPHVCTPTGDMPFIRMDCVFAFAESREAPGVQTSLAAGGAGVQGLLKIEDTHRHRTLR